MREEEERGLGGEDGGVLGGGGRCGGVGREERAARCSGGGTREALLRSSGLMGALIVTENGTCGIKRHNKDEVVSLLSVYKA